MMAVRIYYYLLMHIYTIFNPVFTVKIFKSVGLLGPKMLLSHVLCLLFVLGKYSLCKHTSFISTIILLSFYNIDYKGTLLYTHIYNN
jgi:hypothetical protein